jgi:TetR/AcrR family transcriptional regulator, cholesterol catabolism regulator
MSERGRRQEILQAARVLFREKGYHATTVRDIADMTGLLSGSLYAHIRTKEDLLFEIVNGIADDFLQRLEAALNADGSATDKFRRALRAHIEVVADNLDAAAVFSHEWRALSEERRDVIREKRNLYEKLWDRLIQEGIERGEFQTSHRKFSRIVVLSVANWLYQWYDPEGELSPVQVAEHLADVLLSGLKKTDAK